MIDISNIKKAQEKIEYLAYYDTLTGLPNRTLLNHHLEQIIHAYDKNNAHNALIFIDI